MTSPTRNAPAGNPLAEALLLGYLLSNFGGYGMIWMALPETVGS